MPNCPNCNNKTTAQTLAKYGCCSKCRPAEFRKKTIPKPLRECVWRKRFPTTLDGECYCCRKQISFAYFDCGHILAEALGGATTIDNLEPICKTCNTSMGTQHLLEFKKQFESNQPRLTDQQLNSPIQQVQQLKYPTLKLNQPLFRPDSPLLHPAGPQLYSPLTLDNPLIVPSRSPPNSIPPNSVPPKHPLTSKYLNKYPTLPGKK